MVSSATGVLLVAVGTGLFAFIFTAGKLFAGEVSVFQVLVLRFLGSSLTLGVLFLTLPAFARRVGRSRAPRTHFLRILFGAFGGAGATYAATGMPVVNAAAVGLLEGLLTILFAVLLLNETVSRRQGLAGSLCALGAVVAVFGRGGGIELQSSYILPALGALAGATLMALETIYLRRVALADTPQTALVYTNAFGTLVMALPALAYWQPVSLETIGLVLLLGPLAVVAQFANLKGFASAEVTLLAPVVYSWVVFAALVGWAVYGEVPRPSDLIGAALVVAGGLWLARLPAASRQAAQDRRQEQQGAGQCH